MGFILMALIPTFVSAAPELKVECQLDQEGAIEARLEYLKTKFLKIANEKSEARGRYFEGIFLLSVENWIQLGTSTQYSFTVNSAKKIAVITEQSKAYSYFTPYTYAASDCESCKAEGDRFAEVYDSLPVWKEFEGLSESRDLVAIEKAARAAIAQARPIARDLKLKMKPYSGTDKAGKVSRLEPRAASAGKRAKAEVDRLMSQTSLHIESKVENITLSKDGKTGVITSADESENAPLKCRVLGGSIKNTGI